MFEFTQRCADKSTFDIKYREVEFNAQSNVNRSRDTSKAYNDRSAQLGKKLISCVKYNVIFNLLTHYLYTSPLNLDMFYNYY